jgi:hypothetical protein
MKPVGNFLRIILFGGAYYIMAGIGIATMLVIGTRGMMLAGQMLNAILSLL